MKVFSGIMLSLLLVPFLVSAETVVRVGEGITVDESQVVAGDYYVSVGPFGNTTMSGSVAGDMYALGGSVTTNGSVDNDLTVVSGVAQLHASVTDDVRLLVGEAVIGEHIGGDLFVLGGSLKVLSTASIDGDVYFFGGMAVIDGTVGGSIHGTMERLRIDGLVTGQVDVTVYDTLTLGSKTRIEGDVQYTSFSSLVRAPAAVVEGEVRERNPVLVSEQDVLRSAIIPLLVLLFAALTLYLLFRRQLQKLFTILEDSYVKSGVIGLGVLFLGPIISLLLIVTVLGVIVGLVSFAATVLFILLGLTVSGVMLGAVAMRAIRKQSEINLVTVLVGTILLYSIGFIPIIGPLFALAWVSIAVGGVTLAVYRLIR